MLVSSWTALALVCLCRGLSSQPTPGLSQTCSGHHLLDNQRLDLNKLKLDGATTRRVDAISADDCVRKCCSAYAGEEHACGLAEFDSRLIDHKCLLVHCSACDVHNVINGDEHIKTFSVQAVPTNASDGDHHIKDSTPKIERTIVPRKGVDLPADTKMEIAETGSGHTAVTSDPTSTVHPSNETVTTPDDATLAQSDIAATLPTEPTTNDDTTPLFETLSTGQVSRPAITPVPDLDADKHKHTVPRKGVFSGQDVPLGHHPINNSLSDKQFEFAMLGKPHSEYHDSAHALNENLSNNVTEFVTPIESETPQVEVTQSLPIDGVRKTAATNETTEQKLAHMPNRLFHQTAANKNDGGAIVLVVPLHESGTPPTALTNVSSVVSPTTNDLYLNAQQTDELSIQQSVYLIASLLIGFVVLLTVIGLVMRHVHGVWERRHYHRMDFLIDGMYNTM